MPTTKFQDSVHGANLAGSPTGPLSSQYYRQFTIRSQMTQSTCPEVTRRSWLTLIHTFQRPSFWRPTEHLSISMYVQAHPGTKGGFYCPNKYKFGLSSEPLYSPYLPRSRSLCHITLIICSTLNCQCGSGAPSQARKSALLCGRGQHQ